MKMFLFGTYFNFKEWHDTGFWISDYLFINCASENYFGFLLDIVVVITTVSNRIFNFLGNFLS